MCKDGVIFGPVLSAAWETGPNEESKALLVGAYTEAA